MMRASIVLCVFSWRCRHLRRAGPPAALPDLGGRQWRVHNTFVDGQFDRQQRQARQRIGQSDQARVLNKRTPRSGRGTAAEGEQASLLHLDRCQRQRAEQLLCRRPGRRPARRLRPCPTASTPPNTSTPRPSRAGSFAARTAVPTTPGWTRRAACTTRRSRPRSARRASSGRPRLRRRSPSPRAGRSSSSSVRRRCPAWMAPASRAMR